MAAEIPGRGAGAAGRGTCFNEAAANGRGNPSNQARRSASATPLQ